MNKRSLAFEIRLEPGTRIEQDLPADYNGFVVVLSGSGVIGASATPAQAGDVRALMRKARVVPLAATVKPGSALLRSIAGEAAKPPAPQPHPAAAAQEAAAGASLATGSSAAAMSVSYRGRRRR